MDPATIVLLTAEGVTEVDGHDDGQHLWLTADAVVAATGWDPKPEGLCRGDLCVPLRDPAATDARGRVDLALVAEALHRPLALARPDTDTVVASLGEAAHERAEALAEGRPPRLELTDMAGRAVPLPDLERRKRVLLAWSSW